MCQALSVPGAERNRCELYPLEPRGKMDLNAIQPTNTSSLGMVSLLAGSLRPEGILGNHCPPVSRLGLRPGSCLLCPQ